MMPKGHKVVIYFYEEHGTVVDTTVSEKGVYTLNNNKAHFKRNEDIAEAINKVFLWKSKKENSEN